MSVKWFCSGNAAPAKSWAQAAHQKQWPSALFFPNGISWWKKIACKRRGGFALWATDFNFNSAYPPDCNESFHSHEYSASVPIDLTVQMINTHLLPLKHTLLNLLKSLWVRACFYSADIVCNQWLQWLFELFLPFNALQPVCLLSLDPWQTGETAVMVKYSAQQPVWHPTHLPRSKSLQSSSFPFWSSLLWLSAGCLHRVHLPQMHWAAAMWLAEPLFVLAGCWT